MIMHIRCCPRSDVLLKGFLLLDGSYCRCIIDDQPTSELSHYKLVNKKKKMWKGVDRGLLEIGPVNRT
jgi:hypothetical protein